MALEESLLLPLAPAWLSSLVAVYSTSSSCVLLSAINSCCLQASKGRLTIEQMATALHEAAKAGVRGLGAPALTCCTDQLDELVE